MTQITMEKQYRLRFICTTIWAFLWGRQISFPHPVVPLVTNDGIFVDHVCVWREIQMWWANGNAPDKKSMSTSHRLILLVLFLELEAFMTRLRHILTKVRSGWRKMKHIAFQHVFFSIITFARRRTYRLFILHLKKLLVRSKITSENETSYVLFFNH